MIRNVCLALILFFFPLSVTFAQTYTPAISSCTNPAQINGSTEPIPACPAGPVSDAFSYIVPCQDADTAETTPCHIGASVYGDGFAHSGNVDNRVYSSNGYAVQASNDKHLLYKISGNNLMFLQDTTWANSSTCNEGGRAFQRINGGNGQLWAYNNMSCGQRYETPGTNAAFRYDPANEINLRSYPSNVNSCTNPFTGSVGGEKEMLFHGNAMCGSYSGPMLVLRNVSGAGAGEVFMYCQNRGLCGWYQKIDFSKPGAQPATWTPTTDICNGFQANYGSCKVQCPVESGLEGTNKVVNLTFKESFRNFVHKSLFNINLIDMKGLDEHDIAIENKDYQDRVTRTLLPGEIDYRTVESGNYNAPPESNRVPLKQNNNKVPVTVRGAIKTDGENIVEQNGGGAVTGSEQMLSSTKELDSDDHCKDCQKIDDNNKVQGSITSINTVSKNTSDSINLTKPSNILEDNIFVPCDGSNTVGTASVVSLPQGENHFPTTGNALTDLSLNISGGFADLLSDLLSLLGLDQLAERTLDIPTKLCSCTKISNDTDLKQNTRISTHGMLPSQVNEKLDALVPNGEQTNKFSNPIEKTNGTPIDVTMSFSGTNHVLSSMTAEECASMPPEVQRALGYGNKCGTIQSGVPTSDWAINNDTTPIDVSMSIADTTPVGDAITDAAEGNIPRCVLEEIKIIETGPNWTPPAQCTINACSAAGPFQITTGVDMNGDRTCPQCGNLGYCPDAWPNNWPIDQNAPSPCDVRAAADAAVNVIQNKARVWTRIVLGSAQQLVDGPVQSQRDAIILAGDGYFGSSQTHARLGGCSYGEAVYKHCDPTYQCGTPGRPTLQL